MLLAGGRRRQRPDGAGKFTKTVTVDRHVEERQEVHTARTRSSASSRRAASSYAVGTLKGKLAGKKVTKRERASMPRRAARRPGRAVRAAAADPAERLRDPQPRAQPDQPQPARPVGAHEPDRRCASTRSRARATCSATCCAGSPNLLNPSAPPTRRSASWPRSSTRCWRS